MNLNKTQKNQYFRSSTGPWWTPLALAGASLAVNLMIWIIARLFGPPSFAEFEPLAGPGSVILLTILGAFGAYFVYWFITLTTSRPNKAFVVVSLITLILSLIPDIEYPNTSPGYSLEAIVILMVFHFSSAIIDVGLLLYLVRKHKKKLGINPGIL